MTAFSPTLIENSINFLRPKPSVDVSVNHTYTSGYLTSYYSQIVTL